MSIKKEVLVRGIILKPDDIGLDGVEGELKVGLTSKKLTAYLNGAVRAFVDENSTQVLTNKSIDADFNVITNIEVADLKAGVIDTDLTSVSAADDTIPSAKATKAYVDSKTATGAAASQAALDAHINDTTDAHAASTITVTPTGTISSINVQAALAEISGDVTAISTASGITNVPSGNLAATNVQSALNELQSDIDTRATTTALNAHINNTTGAHAASAISVSPTGNLASTTVQAALVELQTDIDGKVSGPASATNNAIVRYDSTTGKLVKNSVGILSDSGALTGLTGVSSTGTILSDGNLYSSGQFWEGQETNSASTGSNATLPNPARPVVRLTNSSLVSIDMIADDSIVGGRNITLYNQTGNSITINNDTGATANRRILTGTKSALVLADQAAIQLKYDEVAQRYLVIGGTGAGVGSSLDTIAQVTGTDIASWTSGNNAAFLGGGTLAGTFVADTTTPLQGISSYKYTQAAGSLNDYAASAVQSVDRRFQGRSAVVSFPFTYNGGASDIQVIVYCATTLAILTPNALLPISTTNGIFQATVTIPLTCTGIRVGFQTKIANSGKIFAFDSIQLGQTLQYVPQPSSQSSYILQVATITGGNNVVGGFTGSSGTGVYTYNSTTGFYGVTKAGSFVLAMSLRANSASAVTPSIVVNGSELGKTTGGTTGLGTWSSASWTGNLAVGDTFRFSNQSNTADQASVSVLATALSDQILTAPETFSTDTNALTYASSAAYTLATLNTAPVGTFITFTYAANTSTRTQTTVAPTQTTSDMNANGILIYTRAFNAASTASQPSVVALQIGKGLKGHELGAFAGAGKTFDTSIARKVVSTTVEEGLDEYYNPITGILFLDAGYATIANTTRRFLDTITDVSRNSVYLTINSSKNPSLVGITSSAVAARGVSSSGQIIPNTSATIVTWDTAKSFDTNGALNTSTGVFTAPESGYYQVSGLTSFESIPANTTADTFCQINKNGSLYAWGNRPNSPATAGFIPYMYSTASTSMYLAKGETASLAVYQSSGASRALVADPLRNHFSIIKVGN